MDCLAIVIIAGRDVAIRGEGLLDRAACGWARAARGW